MNPRTEPPIPQLQPPLPPQPHLHSTYCDRHPDENFTGFCSSCLCERLAILEPSTNGASSSRKTFTTTAAIKAIFRPSLAAAAPSSAELRRTKSFSASKNEGLFSGIFEPQRKSCDVRVRGTLCNATTVENGTQADTAKRKVGEQSEAVEEITPLEEAQNSSTVEGRVSEIVKERNQRSPELTMKGHVNLDLSPKKTSSDRDLKKDMAGSFWSAASVFSKKLQKWRSKQKLKKQREEAGGVGRHGRSTAALPVEKSIGCQLRDTQSEIADYGFGRRSCDADPRFSLDVGRISFDNPRCSIDEPRASWDGCMIGRSLGPSRMGPTMVSVMEDNCPPIIHHVIRTDAQIPLEGPIDEEDDYVVPGGSAQTRDYYQDSSCRRRKSFDRSGSFRKNASAMAAVEMDASNSSKNAKVSPARMMDVFQCTNLIIGDKDLRDTNTSSLRDDCSEMFEIGFRENSSAVGNDGQKGLKKSSRWKAWSIWGLIHRRGGNKDGENYDHGCSIIRGNGMERSLSGSWQDRNRDSRPAFNRRMFRSNSSVSWRNSYGIGGSVGKKNGEVDTIDINEHRKKRGDEFSLNRNHSARYSTSDVDNGLLKLYLAPKRGGDGWWRNRHGRAWGQ
ncbi:hypothetical protein SAY86_021797 [Trapa natans]|uniref:Uncharacterized protein n=1 Tax=Trapa natans TaxID=22666 RepID=A0AAN7MT13_TRANT|nr:hypothetical protein SAY86_021797 [Trapa natans]